MPPSINSKHNSASQVHCTLLIKNWILNLGTQYSLLVDNVLIDKRLPRWNILYLFQLKKKISKISFKKIYDLQNSSRTSFYRKFLFTKYEWSSSETILESDETKSQFDSEPVLKRFETQLIKSGVKPGG